MRTWFALLVATLITVGCGHGSPLNVPARPFINLDGTYIVDAKAVSTTVVDGVAEEPETYLFPGSYIVVEQNGLSARWFQFVCNPYADAFLCDESVADWEPWTGLPRTISYQGWATRENAEFYVRADYGYIEQDEIDFYVDVVWTFDVSHRAR